MKNNQLVWKSEKEMQDELKREIGSWKPDESKDGLIVFAEGRFIYKRIAYLIKVLRYYNHTDKFTPMTKGRVSDCHAVVETPDETKPIIDIIPSEFESEFLYHDTLHSFNDNQMIAQQIEVCHKWAKEDIDNLLDGEISRRIGAGVKALQKSRRKLERKVKELKKP